MVAGGVFGSVTDSRKVESKYVLKPSETMFQKGINLQHDAVSTFQPENN